MDSAEFTEWVAFFHLEPDAEREQVRLLGTLMQLFANVHRDQKVKPEPYDLDDFIPDPYGIPKAQRLQEHKAIMARMRAAAARRRQEKKAR